MGIGFSAKSFSLLEKLRDNCNREWYHANKADIAEHCIEPFAFLLTCVSQELSDHSVRLSGGKQSMFRLNRDVRFAKDKSPYNHHVSGTLTRSGRKNEQGGLVYLRLDPTGGRLGAGYFGLTAKRMGPIRDKILDDPRAFQDMVDGLDPMKRNDWKGDGIVQTVVDFAKATTPILEFGLVSVERPKMAKDV